jgi:hypothetical protein
MGGEGRARIANAPGGDSTQEPAQDELSADEELSSESSRQVLASEHEARRPRHSKSGEATRHRK